VTIDLTAYDLIVINTSAGKDSQAMLDFVAKLAKRQGVFGRVRAVHCDLGRMEWAGTRELAEEQCKAYGVPLYVVRRELSDLISQVIARGMWPSSTTRYCTSDQKRAQVWKLFTALVAEWRAERKARGEVTRACRVLNCMGFRAEESPARAARQVLSKSKASNGKREVFDWLPVHDWPLAKVWETIKASGVRHHRAYDLGMPRLSCVFCIFAPKSALMVAGEHNPELLTEYVQVEQRIGHDFRKGFKIAEVKAALDRGERVNPKIFSGDGGCWNM